MFSNDFRWHRNLETIPEPVGIIILSNLIEDVFHKLNRIQIFGVPRFPYRFWIWIFIGNTNIHRQAHTSLKIHEWENCGYSHLFSMNWVKIFPCVGKSMETSFSYLRLCGFLNFIDFYSKPIVWGYISYPHNIPLV